MVSCSMVMVPAVTAWSGKLQTSVVVSKSWYLNPTRRMAVHCKSNRKLQARSGAHVDNHLAKNSGLYFPVPSVSVPETLHVESVDYERGRLHLMFQQGLTSSDFEAFSRLNKGLKIDHVQGDCLVVNLCSPSSVKVGYLLYGQLDRWNDNFRTGAGAIHGDRVGYALPGLGCNSSGSVIFKIPDLSGFYDKRTYREMPRESSVLVIGAPEVVIEVATDPSDLTNDKSQVRESLLKKMEVFGVEGCKLGLVFDYRNKVVWKYHYCSPGFDMKQPVCIKEPKTGDVTGEDVLPGFVVDFDELRKKECWGLDSYELT